MPATQILFPTIRPKLTEAFLLAQADVLDASVWVTDGQMHAHVTLTDDAQWTRDSLRKACLNNLGIGQTPTDIILMGARRRAA